ncbi:hypothetical protein AOLI_G00002440 [Acnodon oligacanthus]
MDSPYSRAQRECQQTHTYTLPMPASVLLALRVGQSLLSSGSAQAAARLLRKLLRPPPASDRHLGRKKWKAFGAEPCPAPAHSSSPLPPFSSQLFVDSFKPNKTAEEPAHCSGHTNARIATIHSVHSQGLTE